MLMEDDPAQYEKDVQDGFRSKNKSQQKDALEFQRKYRISSPEVAMVFGSRLVNAAYGLGEELWSVLEQLCIASLHMNMTKWSMSCIKKLADQFPNSKRVRRLHGLYFEKVGNYDKALEIYRSILTDMPENVFARKRQIIILKSQRKYVEAIASAVKYLELFQTDKEIWHELGELYLEVGQVSKALYCFEELLLHDVRNLYVVLTVAELYYSQGDNYETARKYFSLACDLDESNPRALWGLYFVNLHLLERDCSDKMDQLQKMCIAKIRNLYKGLGKNESTEPMLSLLVEPETPEGEKK